MAEVLLYDEDGNLVAKRTGYPGQKIVFHALSPGNYRLAPALRPCDGNCGYLDGRINPCRTTILVHGTVQVRVAYQPGVTCTISR